VAKVFISYRRVDADAVKQLAIELQLAGHTVWFDEWRIDLGDSIVGRMNEGLAGAAYLILCCSTSGVDTPWISREWLSALARQLDGHDMKVLPVLLSGGFPPPILADVKYADLSTDWSDGMRQLLRAIR
jgi:TIR domain